MTVELLVLEGIDDVEPGRPGEDREADEKGQELERPAHGNPRSDRSEREAQPQDEVRSPGESLGVGVAEEKC